LDAHGEILCEVKVLNRIWLQASPDSFLTEPGYKSVGTRS
jgi:hypothetical protein